MAEAVHYRSARLVRMVGGVLALVLAIGLALVLKTDYERRVEAARVQTKAFADSGQHLLGEHLGVVQRAMEGVASDSAEFVARVPDRAQALISENMTWRRQAAKK